MKIVIYTCLVGDYDNLCDPRVVKKEYDYICFTDNPIDKDKNGVWNMRSIPYECQDQTRLSRYVKINPHVVLSDYDYSIYMDSNLCIIDNDFYIHVEKMINDGTLMASVKHPDRNCIYDEIDECIKRGRDDYFSLKKVNTFLKENKFPVAYGLYENNLILRAHNNQFIKSISEQWWNCYMKLSKRDQLSLCYVLWRNNFRPVLFFSSKSDSQISNSVKRMKHTSRGFIHDTRLRFKIHILNPILKILFPF